MNGVAATGDTPTAPAAATSAGLGGVGAGAENPGAAALNAGAEKLGAGACDPPIAGARKPPPDSPANEAAGACAAPPVNPRPSP